MKIETKFSVGDSILYFSTEHMKLVHATITQVHISISEAQETDIKYTLDIAPVCSSNCSLENDLAAWLASPKGVLVESVITSGKYLFGSKDEFDKEIYPHHEVYAEPIKSEGTPLWSLNKDTKIHVNT